MNDQIKEVLKQQQSKADEKLAPTESERMVVGFMVGEEEFAVPILSIKEIIKPIEFTRVPGVPAYVMGVFNLRGTVIPLINLRLKFGLPPERQNEDTRYIVMNENDQILGFLVDRLTESVRFKESNIDPAPETIQEGENIIYGVGKKDDRIITILKTEGLLKRSF
ncbi:MAG: chemotaxis protein CheW [Helicobacter sp.]|nr:chemotaxis protein CheW [Helicobacter sp.]